jgi:hypothetical protein
MGLSRTLSRAWPILAVLVAAGPLGLAAPASAEDNMPPKVKTLSPSEGPAGAVVLAKGLNFSDKREDVQVLAGSARCLVLAVGLEEVRFIIPALPKPPPGPLEIHIRIKDRDAGNAVFKIVEKARGKVDKGEQQKYEGVGGPEGDPFKENEKFLSIKKVTIVAGPKGENPSCVVEGESALPNDFSIAVKFGFAGAEEKQIAATKHSLHGPTWKVVFGPYTGQLFLAGNYYVQAEFNLAKQNALDMRKAGWPDRLSESERAARAVIVAKKLKEVGTEADRRSQDDEIATHYTTLASKTTTLLDRIDRAYCSAGRAYFRKPAGSGIDEDEWAKWVQARGFGQSGDDLKALRADARFVNAASFFNAVAWQTWVETVFYKDLAEVYARHKVMRTKYVGTRDERVQAEGDNLCAITLGLTQEYTKEIFDRNKLVVPDTLKDPADLSGMDTTVAISRPSFEAHRKLLLERLRVPTFDPGKAPEAPKKADSAPRPAPAATPAKPEVAPVTSPAPAKVEAPAPPPAQANPAPAEEPKTQPPKDAPKEGPR